MRALLIIALCVSFGCRRTSAPQAADAGVVEAAVIEPVPAQKLEQPAPSSVAPETSQAVARDLSRFGISLYQAHAKDATANLALSPASASAVFALAYPGARNKTALVMEKVFGFEPPAREILAAHSVLLARGEPGCTVEAAFGAFRARDLELRPEYEELLATTASAESTEVDFADAKAARSAINAWATARTHGMIPEVVPARGIDARSRFVLANTVYFKGTWLEQFKAANTRPDRFRAFEGDRIVPFMSHQGSYRFAALKAAEVIELPYQCGNWVMLFLLPWDGVGGLEPGDDLPAETGLGLTFNGEARAKREVSRPTVSPAEALANLERALSVELFEQADRAMELRRLVIRVPRVELASTVPLGTLLESSLGAAHLFTDEADFSGMTSEKSFYIQRAFHAAKVRIDEEGTEAAAASALHFGGRGGGLDPDRFTLDRPFLFAIRDRTNGALLFLGRVADPSQ